MLISPSAFLAQMLQFAVALAAAPLLTGWVNQCRAWLQNKTAPSLLLPYRQLHKLFYKEPVAADNASMLFRTAPYIVFGCMALACGIVPALSTDLPLAPSPTRSRWLACSRSRGCSYRWPPWTSAPRLEPSGHAARC